MPDNAALLDDLIALCRSAGEAILEVYRRSEGFESATKADRSPVTEADLAAHAVLHPALQAIDRDVPVLSEESTLPAWDERRHWKRYWIIDPLDGTKEFIKRNGEFTVNVALIDRHRPVLGIVHVPVSGITYCGGVGLPALRIDANGREPIHCRRLQPRLASGAPVEVVASRSHGAAAVDTLLERIGAQVGTVQTKNMGSSLKFCLVAEGAADLYPRLALTSEWDTAAAQAIVEAAGGLVIRADTLEPLQYNAKEEILNPFFHVIGDPEFDWKPLLRS